MPTAAELTRQALQLHQTGDLAGAEELYLQAAQIPDVPAEALLYLGALYCQRREYPTACAWFDRAQAAGADHPALHVNYGLALMETGQPEAALAHLTRGLQQDPNSREAEFNLGRCQLQLGRNHEAAETLAKTAAAAPDDGEALSNYGLALVRSGHAKQALEILQHAFDLLGETANLRRHIGEAWEQLKNYPEAFANYQRSCDLAREVIESWLGMARVSALAGDFAAGINLCGEAETIAPGGSPVPTTAAVVQLLAGNNQAAAQNAQLALERDAKNGEACGLLALALARQGEVSAAEAYYVKAHEYSPDTAAHYLNHANNLIAQGLVSEALDCSQKALQLDPQNPAAFSNLLLHLHYPDGTDRTEIADLHRRWAQLYVPAQPAAAPRPAPGIRRIGFLSGDLRQHSVAYFLEPLLRGLQAAGREVVVYSNNPRDDALTARLRKHATAWREIRFLDDQTAAKQITADQPDALIELSGHTDHNRLPLFACAPVLLKASWLGYPDTTGIPGSFRIVDEITDPAGAEEFCSERLLRLPECFLCYQPPEAAPPVSLTPNLLGTGPLAFGSFNNPAKLSDRTIRLWASILTVCAESILRIKSRGLDNPQARQTLLQRLQTAGISPQRVELLPPSPTTAEHLAAYSLVDIALDTIPYNGTTTTCEALWMGVPVITCTGDRHCARVGASLLRSAGIGELVMDNDNEYLTCAVSLAGDRKTRLLLREGLRANVAAAPLLQPERFSTDFLAALESGLSTLLNLPAGENS